MSYRGLEGEGCGVVEGLVRRGWMGVVRASARAHVRGGRDLAGVRGGFEVVLSSVQH